MTRREQAIEYFNKGANCTQAVTLAFSDLLPCAPDILARMASSFGGGMGRLREVCGAVSGMFLVLGFLYGFDAEPDRAEKTAHYARIQALAHEFEAEEGSIVCRQLLGLTHKEDCPTPQARTPEYYKKRPCQELVGLAADLLERYLLENPLK